ncbi:hypothetical protein NN561_019781 [Cricetulus griseus]
MAGAESPAGCPAELEPVVSLVDVLEEDEELENEACAVLGASDSEKCSYSQFRVYVLCDRHPFSLRSRSEPKHHVTLESRERRKGSAWRLCDLVNKSCLRAGDVGFSDASRTSKYKSGEGWVGRHQQDENWWKEAS